MNSICLRTAAKVNLFLEILAERPDGYHEVVMILQSLDLVDLVELVPARAISVVCTHPLVPTDRTNLVWQAAELLQQACGVADGVEIKLDKRIPVAAGLAGGSADAAAVLVGLNMLWQLGLTQKELQVLAARLGSDIPFCVSGGTALATGRGEVLSPLPVLDGLHLVLVKPRDLQVSTAWAYRTYRAGRSVSMPAKSNSANMVAAVTSRDAKRIASLLYNDLEAAVLPTHPEVARLRRQLLEYGALGTLMSGSGPTVFGLTASRTAAEQLYTQICQDPKVEAFLCMGAVGGVMVDDRF
ncbi:MAG: 4-(cytidine 5'-diphospho)-2-C-methyl-D-erythritol kinase [Gemmatimonadaceae bacterium]|nr:4-(cytidine 5'-diphospho)-2-C-methyl-D-erythritol kinase [Gloeobacterales cyanobacterium ES-bin-141]